MSEYKQPGYTIIKKPRANSKRGDILKAAIKTFCYYGYTGASMSLIAKEAGVSKGIINKYFISKEKLFGLCVSKFIAEFCDKIEASLQDTQDYRKHAENMFELFQQNRAELKLLLSTIVTPSLADMAKETMSSVFESMAAVLKASLGAEQCEGEFELNYTMFSMLISYVIGGNEENFRRASEAVLDKFLL